MKRGDLLWGLGLAAVIAWLVTRNFFLAQPEFPLLRWGPLQLTSFGPLVALDLLFAFYLVRRWCLRFDLDWEALAGGLVWIAGLGLYISHLVSIAFYFPEELTDLVALLDFRTRISSFGGIYGGALVAILYLRRQGLEVWRYADALAYGFVGGYVFGRAGCFSVHDHPGRATDFLLGVEIGGVRRHDLGFYEMWLMLALLLAITWLARRRRPAAGTVVAFAATLYAPVRFLFDFLRIEDPTYAGLTPGQWMAIPLFLIGLWAWRRAAANRRAEGRAQAMP